MLEGDQIMLNAMGEHGEFETVVVLGFRKKAGLMHYGILVEMEDVILTTLVRGPQLKGHSEEVLKSELRKMIGLEECADGQFVRTVQNDVRRKVQAKDCVSLLV